MTIVIIKNRSGSRGFSVVSHTPVGSIIMYATSANSTAADGNRRNGLFTSQLLNNLKTPGLEVTEVFKKTGQDVLKASEGKQYPEISIKFFETAYLGTKLQPGPSPNPTPTPVNAAKEHYDKGELFREKGDWDATIKEYTEAIRIDPNFALAYNNRGWAYKAKGNTVKANAGLC